MNQFVFANNVQTTLAAAITSPTQATIELSSAANIPAIPAGYYWALTLNDAATQSIFEIVYVTNTSGANLTVRRGQEGTTARTWGVNDLAYACATAGTLSSFLAQAQAGNFVELSPASEQTGFINISGGVTSHGQGRFVGVDLGGGPLTSATDGQFSSYVSAESFSASRPYANTTIATLPILVLGSATQVGIGPSSGLTAQGITASMLAIGAANTGKLIVMDTAGNLATSGSLYGVNGYFSSNVSSTGFIQNGELCVDDINSPLGTISISRTSGQMHIDVANTGEVSIGSILLNDGNGGSPSIALPNYGEWFIEATYALQQTTATQMTVHFYLSGGTITGGFLSNANGLLDTNAMNCFVLYGKGHTTANNQTLTFALTVSGGALDPSNQPWTVRATRTA